jgi:hypothetical protein
MLRHHLNGQRFHEGQRVTLPEEIIVDAPKDQGASMAISLGHQFFTAEPECPLNAFIQGSISIMTEGLGCDGHSKIAAAAIGRRPEIGADEKERLYPKTGFLHRFTDQCFEERFTAFNMACGLIDHRSPLTVPLFDEEETAIIFDHGGNGKSWANGG